MSEGPWLGRYNLSRPQPGSAGGSPPMAIKVGSVRVHLHHSRYVFCDPISSLQMREGADGRRRGEGTHVSLPSRSLSRWHLLASRLKHRSRSDLEISPSPSSPFSPSLHSSPSSSSSHLMNKFPMVTCDGRRYIIRSRRRPSRWQDGSLWMDGWKGEVTERGREEDKGNPEASTGTWIKGDGGRARWTSVILLILVQTFRSYEIWAGMETR